MRTGVDSLSAKPFGIFSCGKIEIFTSSYCTCVRVTVVAQIMELVGQWKMTSIILVLHSRRGCVTLDGKKRPQVVRSFVE